MCVFICFGGDSCVDHAASAQTTMTTSPRPAIPSPRPLKSQPSQPPIETDGERGPSSAEEPSATTLVALTACAAVVTVVIIVISAVLLLRQLKRRSIRCIDRRHTPPPVQIEMSPMVAQPEHCHSESAPGQLIPSPVTRFPYDGYMMSACRQQDSAVPAYQQV